MFKNEIGKQVSVILCTVLFSATMVLSAVGPARAAEANCQHSPEAVGYLA